ncbi:MAG TPA: MBL fold metallo-hydrolase [Desulfotomaculum sp.]|nr:MBL fold metallo-hydrolase [Desulfotomaculum sp.]
MKSKLFFVFLLSLALIVLPRTTLANTVYSQGQIKVHFISVGHGDSIYVSLPENNDILIDGGNKSFGPAVVDYLNKQAVDDIEILLATHPHNDHIGGLENVLSNFTVEKVVDNGNAVNTEVYRSYQNAVLAEGCVYEKASNQIWSFGPFIFKLWGPKQEYNNENNKSVVALLNWGKVKFLFPGDAEKEREAEMLNEPIAAKTLKVGHHGSITSTSPQFLLAVSPKVAVISTAVNDVPQETLAKLAAAKVKMYRTDLDGTVVITTDGKTFIVNTEKGKFGDMNADGNVNILDLLWMAARIGPTTNLDSQWADINNDDRVNILDLLTVAQNIGA